MAKEEYTKLRIVLLDSDIEGLRKLGDYIHVDAHEQSVASKDREIAGLKKKATETAEIWRSVVVALGMQDDLRESIKDIPRWCLDRVRFILDLETAATERNEEYEKQIAELQETTLLRTEHEARVNEISKEKMEVETQLITAQESLTEAQSQVKSLKVDVAGKDGRIEGQAERIRFLTEDQQMWKSLYMEAVEKSWFHKLWETLT